MKKQIAERQKERNNKMRFSKLEWYFRQLFPLTYRSHYTIENNIKMFSVWKMWMGKVYKHESFIV